MKINNYFITLKSRIDLLNEYLQNPVNYKDLNNPFASTLPKTYVWVEEIKKETN